MHKHFHFILLKLSHFFSVKSEPPNNLNWSNFVANFCFGAIKIPQEYWTFFSFSSRMKRLETIKVILRNTFGIVCGGSLAAPVCPLLLSRPVFSGLLVFFSLQTAAVAVRLWARQPDDELQTHSEALHGCRFRWQFALDSSPQKTPFTLCSGRQDFPRWVLCRT